MALYYFPPFADVSGVRAAKFCKYLPDSGWIPTVLTVDQKYYGTKVVDQQSSEPKAPDVWRIPYVAIPGAVTLVKLLYPIVIAATALKHRQYFHAVYFCGSPFHPFAATWFTTRMLGIPSVIDFRDSWSINEGFDRHSGPAARSRLHFFKRIELATKRFLEWIGIRHASRVTFATSTLQDEYAAVFPRYRRKFQTITNGYDPDDFVNLTPRKVRKGEKVIVLTGKFLLYTPTAAELFLQALREFPKTTFLYIGAEAEDVENLAKKTNCASQVVTFPYMPYQQALELIKGSNYGLVTTGLRNGLGTKIFDYLALGKPTLCIVPRGSAIAQAFAETPMIKVCESPHSIRQVQQSLLALVRQTEVPEHHDMTRFSRIRLTMTLGKTLGQISEARRSGLPDRREDGRAES